MVVDVARIEPSTGNEAALFGGLILLYLIKPASRGKVRLMAGMQMISNSPANSASMYGT